MSIENKIEEDKDEIRRRKNREYGEKVVKCDICNVSFRAYNRDHHNKSSKHSQRTYQRTLESKLRALQSILISTEERN